MARVRGGRLVEIVTVGMAARGEQELENEGFPEWGEGALGGLETVDIYSNCYDSLYRSSVVCYQRRQMGLTAALGGR